MITVNPDTREQLLRSINFLEWEPLLVNIGKPHLIPRTKSRTKAKPTPEVTERFYSVQDIARMWNISTDLVRDLFRDVHGVLKVNRPSTRTKRGYSTIRVPHSVLVRVHASVSQ
jgi:hypothetical protein